jgi:hypothetical protein
MSLAAAAIPACKQSQILSRRFVRRKKRGGPGLGSKVPQGRVPLIRPRRGRVMGSSILASLSETGGNDPLHPASRPLPPHLRDVADRVGTRPTPRLVQVGCPFLPTLPCLLSLIYQQLRLFHFARFLYEKPESGIASRFGLATFFSTLTSCAHPPSRLVHSFPLPHNVLGIFTA